MSGCGFQLLFFGLITNCWVPFYYLSLPRVESLSRSRRGRFSSSFFLCFCWCSCCCCCCCCCSVCFYSKMSDWLAGQAGCRCSPLAALAAGPPVFHLFPTCKVSIHQPVKGDANAAVSPIGCTFFISTTDCSTVFFCCLNGNGFGRDFTQIFFKRNIMELDRFDFLSGVLLVWNRFSSPVFAELAWVSTRSTMDAAFIERFLRCRYRISNSLIRFFFLFIGGPRFFLSVRLCWEFHWWT